MDVKEAVRTAKTWLVDTLADESVANLGLEEVDFDDRNLEWKVTLGFSRPWNSARGALANITGEPVPRRAYRVITVDDVSGKVKSMKKGGAQD